MEKVSESQSPLYVTLELHGTLAFCVSIYFTLFLFIYTLYINTFDTDILIQILQRQEQDQLMHDYQYWCNNGPQLAFKTHTTKASNIIKLMLLI